MEKTEYDIHDDGYAVLRTCEQVRQYFIDNDIIGKQVKSAGMYLVSDFDCYFFGGIDLSSGAHGSLKRKMYYFSWYPTYFVCEFTDGTNLSVDYSYDPGVYMKYGYELTLPGGNLKYILPAEYNSLFDNLRGEVLTGVTIPTDYTITKSNEGKFESGVDFGPLFFDFSNQVLDQNTHQYVIINGEKEGHSDSVMTYCEIRDQPIISYYSDRNIPYFEQSQKTIESS